MGVQSALTSVNVDQETGKAIGVYINCVPNRTSSVLAHYMKRKIPPSSTVTTDCFAAYPGALKEIGIPEENHMTVNTSKEFKDPTICANAYNVEGIHKALKLESWKQFGRLPIIDKDGVPHYLDLVSWRVNYRLKCKDSGTNPNLFKYWICAIMNCTHDRPHSRKTGTWEPRSQTILIGSDNFGRLRRPKYSDFLEICFHPTVEGVRCFTVDLFCRNDIFNLTETLRKFIQFKFNS